MKAWPRTDIAVGDIVQHFKHEMTDNPGNQYLYKIVGVAYHTDSLEPMVVYQALYENDIFQFDMFVRPFLDFMSEVDHEKYPFIKQRYKFEKYNGRKSV